MKIYHILEVSVFLSFWREIKTSMGPKANETLLDVILYISRPLTIVSKQGFVFLAENIEFFIRRPATIKLPKILANLNLSENFGWGSEL